MPWFKTYIGKLIALYASMLLLIITIAVPSFYYRHQQQKLALEAMSEPVCQQCIYDDILASGSRNLLHQHLNSRLKEKDLGYLLFTEDRQFTQGNLAIAEPQFSQALKAHFAFTDLPYRFSHDMESDTMTTLFKLKDGAFLLLEDKMSTNPESAQYLISQLEARISQSAVFNSFAIGSMAILAFTFTALVGWKIQQKINKISETSATIIANMDLSKRIPIEHHGNEFNQLAGQLNSMLDAIESRMNDVTAMSNMLAHELRTPLTRFKHKLLLATEQNASLDNLHEALDNIMATFDASLRICRLESGNAKIEIANINAVDVVANAVALLAPIAHEHQQKISSEIECKVCLLDSNLISQALVNLLENAIKYAGQGAAINIRVALVDRAYEISVSDTGKGMSPERLARATELYVRGSSTGHGVGLGLHMVKAIAAAHKGNLYLENKANGFVARLLLPVPPQQFA